MINFIDKKVVIRLSPQDWDEINSMAEKIITRNLALGSKISFPAAQDNVINSIVTLTIEKLRSQSK